MKNLPLEFTERMKNLLGSEYEKFIDAVNDTPVKGFRVNTDKISMEEFEKINIFGKEKIPYVENGFYLDFDKAGNHPFHHAGMIYIQEPGAMAPAECVTIEEDWKILDMCAAPGGKSTQLKNKLGKNGLLVSNEIIPSRCKILTGNIERLGLKNCVTTCMDTSRLAKTFPETFDLIMVDAPCSGEGMFRKDDTAIEEWSVQNVLMCAERQEEILENAVKCLKDSGYIIYATCTFSPEENEMTVASFLEKHPEFEIVPVKKEVKENTSDGISFEGCTCENIHFARRFYPHKSKGEGQFMAVLHNKNERYENKKILPKKQEKVDKIVFDFLDSTLTTYDKEMVTMYNGNPVYFTPDFEIKKGSAFSCGVTIGEIAKNYIKPHHQFFMAMGENFRRKIELSPDSEEIKKYLRGEEISVDCENGWAVVTVNGCSVGGVKISSEKAKNHYPKGLRLL
ncbi:MAG: methyltransferase domain-containing protein [Clostridia bacterium]|nr:methyltransferase domain-containing protein [Clostridia bacterium]